MSDREVQGNKFTYRSAENEKTKNIFARFFLFLGSLQARKRESALSGCVKSALEKKGFRARFLRPARLAIAREIEQSAILALLEKLFAFLLYAPLRMYGTALIVFALGSAVIENVRNYLSTGGIGFLYADVWATVLIVISALLLFAPRKKTLASAINESGIISYLLFEVLGVERGKFEKDTVSEERFLAFVLPAALLALLTIIVPASSIFFVILLLISLRAALVSPETGLLLALGAMPFASSFSFRFMLAAAVFSYLIKCLRGKRNPRSSFYGGILFAFSLLVLFAAIIKPFGERAGGAGVLLFLLCGCLLAVQLMDRKVFVTRTASVMSISAVCASGYLIVSFVFELLLTVFDKSYSAAGLPFFRASLENGEFIGVYLLSALPLMAARFLEKKNVMERIARIVGMAIVLTGAALSRAPAVWIALVAALLFWLILVNRKHIITAVFVTAALLLTYFVLLPDRILEELHSFAHVSQLSGKDVAAQFTDGAGRLFFAFGDAGAYPGGNFYGRLFVMVGLVGALFFLLAVIGCFAFAYYARKNSAQELPEMRGALRGFAVALFGVLFAGGGCDLLRDGKSAFFLFFLCGMILASGKALLYESEGRVYKTDEDIDLRYIRVAALPKKKKAGKGAPSAAREMTSGDGGASNGAAETETPDEARDRGGEKNSCNEELKDTDGSDGPENTAEPDEPDGLTGPDERDEPEKPDDDGAEIREEDEP